MRIKRAALVVTQTETSGTKSIKECAIVAIEASISRVHLHTIITVEIASINPALTTIEPIVPTTELIDEIRVHCTSSLVSTKGFHILCKSREVWAVVSPFRQSDCDYLLSISILRTDVTAGTYTLHARK